MQRNRGLRFVEKVNAHYQRAKAASVDIFMEIRDLEWGARVYDQHGETEQ